MPTLSDAANVGISARDWSSFVGWTESLRTFIATGPLQTMIFRRLGLFTASLSIGALLVAGGVHRAEADDTDATRSNVVSGVERRVPAQPTRALSLTEAVQGLAAIAHSHDAQRHQPVGFPCAGFYPEAPAYTLTLSHAETLRIGATAKNNVDMTMSVQLEDGTWFCNDDAHESTHNPEVFEEFPKGTHTLYFGSYERFQPLDYQAHIVRDEKPDWTHCVEDEVIKDLDETPTVIAGAVSDEVYKCNWMLGSTHCDWLLPSKANACVDLTDTLELSVRTQNATFDTTLVIQKIKDTGDDPTADDLILRNDDIGPNDTHSEIVANLAPGRYLIFVGSYHRQSEGTFELHIGKASTETP